MLSGAFTWSKGQLVCYKYVFNVLNSDESDGCPIWPSRGVHWPLPDESSRDPFVGSQELRVIMSDANYSKIDWYSILAHREYPNNTGSIVRYLFWLAQFGFFFSSGQILNICIFHTLPFIALGAHMDAGNLFWLRYIRRLKHLKPRTTRLPVPWECGLGWTGRSESKNT